MVTFSTLPFELRLHVLQLWQHNRRGLWYHSRRAQLAAVLDERTVVGLSDDPRSEYTLPGTWAGSYVLLIQSFLFPEGCSASNMLSGNRRRGGSVMRATCCLGIHGESVYVSWPESSSPTLKWDRAPNPPFSGVYLFRFKVVGA